MNTDQLKMVMDMLSTMGAAGKDAFVWWLLFDKALPVVGWLATFAGACWVIKYLTDKSSSLKYFEPLRDALRTGSAGPMIESEARETAAEALRIILEHRK